MQEIWKDVKGYEGLYQVSNIGRIKSLPRKTNNQYNNGLIRKLVIRNNGYYFINLYKNNKSKLFTVHRLVAIAFLCNPNNLPCVNHIDGNKLNNNVNNLEWCTYHENEIHAFLKKLKKPIYKKVNQYDMEGNFIKTWNSIKEAQLFYKTTHIGECCRGVRNQTKNYIWKYVNK